VIHSPRLTRSQATRGAFALLAPALLGSCAHEPAAPPRYAPRIAELPPDGLVGAECKKDDDCREGTSCFEYAGRRECLCRPGLTACGRVCRDLAKDPANCGACGSTCGGPACYAGTCAPPVATAPTPPLQLTDFGAGWLEAYPERSLNGGPANAGAALWLGYFSGSRDTRYTVGASATSWRLAGPPLRPVQSENACAWSDPWASSSGLTGLEYVSFLTWPKEAGQCVHKSCIGVGAATGEGLASGSWQYPLACLNPTNEAADGQTIHYDAGAPTLWATANSSKGFFYLYAAPNCVGGPPGGPTCQLAELTPGPQPSLHRDLTDAAHFRGHAPHVFGHTNVAVNPCTHHAVAPYRVQEGNPAQIPAEIRLAFVEANGVVNTAVVHRGDSWQGNDRCADGTAPPDAVCGCAGCGAHMRVVPRVHVATKYDASYDRCFAYLAYEVVDTTRSPRRFQAKLSIVDITHENDTRVVRDIVMDRHGDGQTMLPTVAVSDFNRDVGFFFYEDDGTHCHTRYIGLVDDDLMLSKQRWVTMSTGTFPNLSFGDYVATIENGLQGGDLLPTWNEAVPGAAGPFKCGGTSWRISAMTSRVHP
jgi:hypothetical protein